jgi:hypothetical protein
LNMIEKLLHTSTAYWIAKVIGPKTETSFYGSQ